MPVQKYQKKPVVVEAMQWDGANTEEVVAWSGAVHYVRLLKPQPGQPQAFMRAQFIGKKGLKFDPTKMQQVLKIKNLEGNMMANVGDYIIKGVAGEFYPCKPEIFEPTYGQVEA